MMATNANGREHSDLNFRNYQRSLGMPRSPITSGFSCGWSRWAAAHPMSPARNHGPGGTPKKRRFGPS